MGRATASIEHLDIGAAISDQQIAIGFIKEMKSELKS